MKRIFLSFCVSISFSALTLLPASAAVTITEFMADNGSSLSSAAGDYPDWIELHNDDPNQAADISGWCIGTKKTKNHDNGWVFPDGSTIPANGYAIVFADKLDCVTGREWHANFKLSKDGGGDYLWLIDADGNLACEFNGKFPIQFEDVSYGFKTAAVTLVDGSSPMQWRILPDGEFSDGVGGMGFNSGSGAFSCLKIIPDTPVANLETARRCIANPAHWAKPAPTNLCPAAAFGTAGNFSDRYQLDGANANQYMVSVTGKIRIPSSGSWTFCVSGTDAFELRISSGSFNATVACPTAHNFANTLMACEIPAAGIYDVSLFYFHTTGNSCCELSAASGNFAAFNVDDFTLVGNATSPLQHATPADWVGTDVSGAMLNTAVSAEAQWKFSLAAAPAAGANATLRLRYADGFSAALNGHELASAAASKRSSVEILEPVEIAVPAEFFVAGENTLTITGVNDAIGDPTFLIAPELVSAATAMREFYFKAPTPGAENTTEGYTAPTPEIVSSMPRGYLTSAVEVELATADGSDAEIYYTLDGSLPTLTSRRYTGPLSISSTTVLRAAAVDSGSVRQTTSTYTWLFLADIIRQSSSTPAGWPSSGSVNGHTMKYGMSSSIVNSDGARLAEGMTNAAAVATLSFVTPLSNLFDAGTGIYVNPSVNNDGRAWEREISVEQIDPVHGAANEFQINAGLRLRGAASRTSSNPKHAFRLFFRREYGSGRLNFPLFGEEGADSFNKVDLRTAQNHSWSKDNDATHTMVREVFARDTQRDMGEPYTRSRYYHLFINGIYWGLYQTQERGDADWAESYCGGDADDWDAVKTDANRNLGAADGTMDAYNELWDISINQGYSGSNANNYWRVQGLNPDGTRNPDYPVYLNVDNLIDYIISDHFCMDLDSPVSTWSVFVNNIYALRDRSEASTGFIWLRHDAEHSLGTYPSGYNYPVTFNMFYVGTESHNSKFTQRSNFNPAILHNRLAQNSDYRERFAAAVQRHMLDPGGALTVANAQLRFRQRMEQIDSAIVAESARWGNGKTRATWLSACNDALEFITQRHPVLISQYREAGWIPSIESPHISTNNVALPPGSTVSITADNSFYFTTDGTDPKSSPTAKFVAVANGTAATNLTVNAAVEIVARAYRNGEWSAKREASITMEPDWGALRVTEMMYAAPNSEANYIELMNCGTEAMTLRGVTFTSGVVLTFGDLTLAPQERLLAVRNYTVFTNTYATAPGTKIVPFASGNTAKKGETIAYAAPDGTQILSYTYTRDWYPGTVETGYALEVVNPMLAADDPGWSDGSNWRAGSFVNGTPGTSADAPYDPSTDPGGDEPGGTRAAPNDETLLWNGANGAVWDFSAANWLDHTGAATTWRDGMTAMFDTPGWVNLTVAASPAGVCLTTNATVIGGYGKLTLGGPLNVAADTTNAIHTAATGVRKTGTGALAATALSGTISVEEGVLIAGGTNFRAADIAVANGAELRVLGPAAESGSLITNGSFENNYGTSGYTYVSGSTMPNGWLNPEGSKLVLVNSSGSATWNGSSQQGIPAGSYMLGIQHRAALAQNITVPYDGLWDLSLLLFHRTNLGDVLSDQDLRILVDGTQMAVFYNPYSFSSRQRISSGPVYLTAGQHTVRFEGEGHWVDTTSFVDDIRISPTDKGKTCRTLGSGSSITAVAGARLVFDFSGTLALRAYNPGGATVSGSGTAAASATVTGLADHTRSFNTGIPGIVHVYKTDESSDTVNSGLTLTTNTIAMVDGELTLGQNLSSRYFYLQKFGFGTLRVTSQPRRLKSLMVREGVTYLNQSGSATVVGFRARKTGASLYFNLTGDTTNSSGMELYGNGLLTVGTTGRSHSYTVSSALNCFAENLCFDIGANDAFVCPGLLSVTADSEYNYNTAVAKTGPGTLRLNQRPSSTTVTGPFSIRAGVLSLGANDCAQNAAHPINGATVSNYPPLGNNINTPLYIADSPANSNDTPTVIFNASELCTTRPISVGPYAATVSLGSTISGTNGFFGTLTVNRSDLNLNAPAGSTLVLGKVVAATPATISAANSTVLFNGGTAGTVSFTGRGGLGAGFKKSAAASLTALDFSGVLEISFDNAGNDRFNVGELTLGDTTIRLRNDATGAANFGAIGRYTLLTYSAFNGNIDRITLDPSSLDNSLKYTLTDTGNAIVLEIANASGDFIDHGITGIYYTLPNATATEIISSVYSLADTQAALAQLTPIQSVYYHDTVNGVNFSDDASLQTLPAERRSSDYWIGAWRGVVHLPGTGYYLFRATYDDACVFALDGAAILQGTGCGTVYGAKTLTAGPHDFYLAMFELTGSAYVKLEVLEPGATEFRVMPTSWLVADTTADLSAAEIAPVENSAVAVDSGNDGTVYTGTFSGESGAVLTKSGTGRFSLANYRSGHLDVRDGELAVTKVSAVCDPLILAGGTINLLTGGTVAGLRGCGGFESGSGSEVRLDTFSGDNDCGISPDRTYTHLVDFPVSSANRAVVNGVTFQNTGSWTFSGLGNSTMNANSSGSGFATLVNSFCYNGTDITLTLKSLPPGSLNEFRLYLKNYGNNTRYADLTFGVGETWQTDRTFNLDQDLGPKGAFGAITCRYRANAQGTFSLRIKLTSGYSDTPHLYGFSNESLGYPALRLTVPEGATETFSGDLNSPVPLVVDGSGEQTFNGDLSPAYGLLLDSGTAVLGSGSTATAGVFVAANAVLDLRAATRVDGLGGDGELRLSYGDAETNLVFNADATLAVPGNPRLTHFTCDADSGVSPDKRYLFAVDFTRDNANGRPLEINGVLFNRIAAGGVTARIVDHRSGAGVKGIPSSAYADGYTQNIGMGADQSFFGLLSAMNYDANNKGQTIPLEIDGLTAGVRYETRLYLRSWTPSVARTVRFAFDPDNSGTLTTFELNEDYEGADTPYYLAFRYTASSNAFPIYWTSLDNSNSFHLYGMTVEEVVTQQRELRVASDTVWHGGITGDGQLLKSGGGQLTVLGTVDGAARWEISSGGVSLAGPAATVGAVAVGGGASFGGNAAVRGGVGVAAGSKLTVGTADRQRGLTLFGTNNVVAAGATVELRVGNHSCATLAAGGLTLPADLTLNLLHEFPGGTLPASAVIIHSDVPFTGLDLAGWTLLQDGEPRSAAELLSFANHRKDIVLKNDITATMLMIK